MRVLIDFCDDQQDIKITEDMQNQIQKVMEHGLETEEYDRSCTVGVSFVTEEKIHELNKEFRDVDRVTDVLSFPDGTVNPEDGEIMLGDVIICAKRAFDQSEEYGHSLEREICFLCAHSLLHLLGYDHETDEEDEKIMFAKQKKILDDLGIVK